MKKIISIVATAIISLLTVFMLTFISNKEQDHMENIINDSIPSCINPKDIFVNGENVSEDEILDNVGKAKAYLNETTVKDRDVLLFYKNRMNNLYEIKGLKEDISLLLFSTVQKINQELEKMDVLQRDTLGR